MAHVFEKLVKLYESLIFQLDVFAKNTKKGINISFLVLMYLICVIL